MPAPTDQALIDAIVSLTEQIKRKETDGGRRDPLAAGPAFGASKEDIEEHYKLQLRLADLMDRSAIQQEHAIGLLEDKRKETVRGIAITKAAIVEAAGNTEATAALTEELKKQEEELYKHTRAIKDATKGLNDFESASDSTRSQLGTLATSIFGLRGNLGEAMSSIGKMKGTLHGLGKTALDVAKYGIVNLAGAVGMVFIQAVLDIDSARMALHQATGAGEELTGVMSELRTETMGSHLQFAELAQGLATLRNGLSEFDHLTKKTQISMAVQASMLDKLGFAFEDQVRIQQIMNKGMGETIETAQKTVTNIYKMAKAAGKGPKELAADFQAAAPQLAVYGGKMESEFRRMAAAAKESGLEMQTLLSFTEQFDTFEGAAKAAGTLNAFLGGPYLNTVELVGMTENQRIIAVKRSMEASGRSFKQMERFQQKGIAKSLNMTVDEANRLFGLNEEKLIKRDKAMKAAQKSERNFKEEIMKFAPIMQALQLAFRDIAMEILDVFLPAGKNGEGMVERISTAVSELKGWFVTVTPHIKSFFKGFKNNFGWLTGGLAVLATGLQGVAHWFGVVSKATSGFWKYAGPVFGAIGKAIGQIFGLITGTWSILKGFGNIVTGKVGKGLAQVAGGALQVAAPLVTVGSGGLGIAIGAAMTTGGALLSAKGDTMEDFIYKGDSSGGTIQPIDKKDSFLGVKPGGGMDGLLGAVVRELKLLNKEVAKQKSQLEAIANKKTEIIMDGRKVGETIESHVTRAQNNSAGRGMRYAGRHA